VPTFLVDGRIAGQWDVQRKKDAASLTMTPFAKLPRQSKRELEDEAERLVRWHEPDAASYAVSVAARA